MGDNTAAEIAVPEWLISQVSVNADKVAYAMSQVDYAISMAEHSVCEDRLEEYKREIVSAVMDNIESMFMAKIESMFMEYKAMFTRDLIKEITMECIADIKTICDT